MVVGGVHRLRHTQTITKNSILARLRWSKALWKANKASFKKEIMVNLVWSECSTVGDFEFLQNPPDALLLTNSKIEKSHDAKIYFLCFWCRRIFAKTLVHTHWKIQVCNSKNNAIFHSILSLIFYCDTAEKVKLVKFLIKFSIKFKYFSANCKKKMALPEKLLRNYEKFQVKFSN